MQSALLLDLDVGDEASWEAIAPEIASLDGVVHAAGVLGPIGPAELVDPAEFSDVLRINVLGTFLAARATRAALARSGGAFVGFSGGGGTGPLVRFDAYAASKAAVVRLIENLAEDGMRANAIAPGFVATDIHQATLAAGKDAVGADYFERTRRELASGGTPAELAAELASWLLSDDSIGINGRLLSAPWDPWMDEQFRDRVRSDPNFAKLRRIDGQFFEDLTE